MLSNGISTDLLSTVLAQDSSALLLSSFFCQPAKFLHFAKRPAVFKDVIPASQEGEQIKTVIEMTTLKKEMRDIFSQS